MTNISNIDANKDSSIRSILSDSAICFCGITVLFLASYEVVKRTNCLNLAAVTIPATAGVVRLWRRVKASPALCTSGCFYSAGDASTEVLFARKVSERAHAIPSLRETF